MILKLLCFQRVSSIHLINRSCASVPQVTNGAYRRFHNSPLIVEPQESLNEPPEDKKHSSFSRWRYANAHAAPNPKKELIDSMIRVDHAGEFGAQQIYNGQLAVFRGTSLEPVIKEMADQEMRHLETFDKMIVERRVRPTALFPIWQSIGYAIGVGSALLGKEAAMAVTVAVEEVIGEHYNSQLRTMNDQGYTEESEDLELKKSIKEFRDEELGHLNIGLKHDAEKTPFYEAFTSVIKAGTRTAIWLSTRI